MPERPAPQPASAPAQNASKPQKSHEERMAELDEDKAAIARLEKRKATGSWNQELEDLLQDMKKLVMRKELLLKYGAK